MKTIIPEKLKKGDSIGVVAPSRSISIISSEIRDLATDNLQDLGLTPVISKYSEDLERYTVNSIKRRVSDIHDMFHDKKVKAIFTAIGGYYSKQLLRYIDWGIISDNPKIFCGYSDTTVLSNAIYVKTGLVTYIGPHYSTFGQKQGTEYTREYFLRCCFGNESFVIEPSNTWSDDEWWINQDNREFTSNDGPVVVNEGKAEGIAIGGNLGSFLSLAATDFYPNFDESIVFAEVTNAYELSRFDAKLQSLVLQTGFSNVKALLIGRFQTDSGIEVNDLKKIINSKKELNNIPVVVNLDFGHTQPLFTFPVGGTVKIEAIANQIKLEILTH